MSTTQNTKINRNYITLLIADFISSFGSSMTGVAITLEIYSRTSDLMLSAIFILITLVPKIVITPLIPKINIPGSFRRIFSIGEILCAVLLGILCLNNSIISIFIIYGIFGVIFFIVECYRAEFLKKISNENNIHKYQSVSRTVNVLVTITAPMTAGIILPVVGIKPVYIINIITYIIAGIIILFIDKEYTPAKSKGNINTKFSFQFMKASYIFIGSIVVTFLGGATSILTLAYINDILKVSPFYYTVLMSTMAVGNMLGYMIAGRPFFYSKLKNITIASMILMGILLMLALFQPGFWIMLIILFVSGLLSAGVMFYFVSEIYVQFDEADIRNNYAILQTAIDLSTAASKPFGAAVEKIAGVIYSIVIMGILFVIFSPVSMLKSKKDSSSEMKE